MLKSFYDTIGTKEPSDWPRLFTDGDSRIFDLTTACRSENGQIQAAAYYVLQLLGAPGLGSCADSVQRKHASLLLSTETNLTKAELGRIDRWLTEKRTATGYLCISDDEGHVDNAVFYALILDGSSASKSTLSKVLAFESFCQGESAFIEDLEQADSLIASAKAIGHNLRIEADIVGAVRTSAFFLPLEYRKESSVEVLGRRKDRILLEVSYVCGPLCGRGFHVVLRKDGSVWQYALIRRLWIS